MTNKVLATVKGIFFGKADKVVPAPIVFPPLLNQNTAVIELIDTMRNKEIRTRQFTDSINTDYLD